MKAMKAKSSFQIHYVQKIECLLKKVLFHHDAFLLFICGMQRMLLLEGFSPKNYRYSSQVVAHVLFL